MSQKIFLITENSMQIPDQKFWDTCALYCIHKMKIIAYYFVVFLQVPHQESNPSRG